MFYKECCLNGNYILFYTKLLYLYDSKGVTDVKNNNILKTN